MTVPFRLVVPGNLFAAIVDHARAELPAECCGLLAGTIVEGVGRVTEHFTLVNALHSSTEYESDGRSMLSAHKAMRAAGTEILAVYHSHPTSDPVPSRRDLERNYDERVVSIIIGLRGADADVRAWWLTATGALEADWAVES